MRLSRLLLSSALILLPLAARADVVFTLTSEGPGGLSGSFEIPSTVYLAGPQDCCLTIHTTNFTNPQLDVVTFYDGGDPDYGAFTVDQTDPTAPDYVGYSGPQFYTFSNGYYTFLNTSGTSLYLYTGFLPNEGTAYVESVSISATPEPSSLALLGTGVLGMAGAIRRRLRK